MKYLNFIPALIIYGLFWLAGYHFMVKDDELGIGKVFFVILHIALQSISVVVSLSLILGFKKGYFSIFSFLNLFSNSTALYFLLVSPDVGDQSRLAFSVIMSGMIVFQLYVMIRQISKEIFLD